MSRSRQRGKGEQAAPPAVGPSGGALPNTAGLCFWPLSLCTGLAPLVWGPAQCFAHIVGWHRVQACVTLGWEREFPGLRSNEIINSLNVIYLERADRGALGDLRSRWRGGLLGTVITSGPRLCMVLNSHASSKTTSMVLFVARATRPHLVHYKW